MIILDHINWADHCGDLSGKERVLIDDLLPTVGTDVIYTSHVPLPEGYVSFLWVPPHSEYNGFFDRPYEFVKARLISGNNISLSNDDEKNGGYKFTVDKVETISDVINHFKYVRRIYIREGDKDRIESWRKSFFPKEILQISDWNWAYIGSCDFLGGGNLIYVNEYGCEYNYDVFILEKSGDFFSVFELTTVAGNTFSEPINVKLSEEEIRSLEILMKSIDPIDCSKRYLYDNNEVQGAESR